MAKLRGALFSFDAKGSVANKLTIRKRHKLQVALGYNKPGSKKPFESSPTQKDQRSIVGLVTIRWNCMTAAEKAQWNSKASTSREHISGYNLFLRTAQTNLYQYLGLAGYWSMNYEHQGIIPDLSGQGNNGTLKPTYPSNCPTLAPGQNNKFGLAAKFDGVDDYIDCGNANSLTLLSSFTLEAWIKPSSTTQRTIIAKGTSTGTNYALDLRGTNNKYVAFFVYDTSGNHPGLIPSNLAVENGVWSHIAAVYNGSFFQVFVNNIGSDIASWSGSIKTSTYNLKIGTREGNYYFNNLIDEARIWNRALGPEEIMRHYKMLRQP